MAKEKKGSDKIVEDVFDTAKKAGQSAKKATKKAGSTVKKAAKKADTLTNNAKKAVSTAAKKPVKEQVYLQYGGREVSEEDLMKRVKEIWRKEFKRKVSDLATVSFYLKPEENKAYYVINGEVSGSLDI